MIKLLIVDDEADIRSAIKETIAWEANGIIVCGEASNGKEAIEMIIFHQPDLLLLDIRMPIMDGLEVIKEIKQKELSAKAIVLSGYDDFAYAQDALNNGALAYLLKPCLPEEILEVVVKNKESIEKSKSNLLEYQNLKVQFNDSIPILKERFLIDLIKNKGVRSQKYVELFDLFKLQVMPYSFTVAVIGIDNYNAFSVEKKNEEIELIKLAINNIAKEIIKVYYCCEVFEYNSIAVVIINTELTNGKTNITKIMNDIKNRIHDHFGITVSIGIGRHVQSIDDIYLSYEQAIKALEYRFFFDGNVVLEYDNLSSGQYQPFNYPIEIEKEILNSLRTCDAIKAEKLLDNFFMAIDKYNKMDITLKSSIALLFSMYHLCIEYCIEVDDCFGKNLDFIGNVTALGSLASLKSYINFIAITIIERFSTKKSNKIVEKAIKYVEENYCQSIDLESIASKIYLSPSYFSVLFKQKTGISFIEYLNKLRVEKACKLLADERLKIYEVAYKVGFRDEKYFMTVFKKIKGVTPSQYRDTSVV